MSNKNIDTLFDSMDSFLDDGEDLAFNPQEVMKTFHQKISKAKANFENVIQLRHTKTS